MAFRPIDRDLTRTTWSEAPTVCTSGGFDEPLALELVYASAHKHIDAAGRQTRVRFLDVFEYRWVYSNFTYFSGNQDDFGFCLGEVLDSELVEALLSSTIYSNRGAGERLGGVLKDDQLRHFRIGFDHYGTFDVLALAVDVKAIEGTDA